MTAGIYRLVQSLNALYLEDTALHAKQGEQGESSLMPLDYSDAERNLLAFRRIGGGREIIAVFNFSPVPREQYRIGVSQPGIYEEILNTDSRLFGGSNSGNQGRCLAGKTAYAGMPASLTVMAPPLAACWFRLIGEAKTS